MYCKLKTGEVVIIWYDNQQKETIQAYPLDQEEYFDISWCPLKEYTYNEIEEFDCPHPTKTRWQVEDDKSILEAHHYTEEEAIKQAKEVKKLLSHKNRPVVVSCYDIRDGLSYKIKHQF